MDTDKPTAVPARAGTPVTKDTVIETAMRIVTEEGIEALSMRKLATELGVAVTSIYWHVGNRDVLMGHLVDRVVHQMGDIHPSGETPEERVVSIAHEVRRTLLELQPMVWIAHEHGRSPLMMLSAERALVREVSALGLDAGKSALAVRAILYHVVGFMMVEHGQARQPEQRPTRNELWGRDDQVRLDPSLAAAMAGSYGSEGVFDVSVRALVAGLLDEMWRPAQRDGCIEQGAGSG